MTEDKIQDLGGQCQASACAVSRPIHLVGISDMPRRRKSTLQVITRYRVIVNRLREVELELSRIQEECPEKTGCYLRYGWEFQQPYGHGFPMVGKDIDVHGWEHALADFYSHEANRLLKERGELLKKVYRMASRYYDVSQNVLTLAALYPHLRKPWFKVHL